MAEVALDVGTSVLTKLGIAITGEGRWLPRVKVELHRLRYTAAFLTAVLLDAEDRQMTDPGAVELLKGLKVVFYELDDLLVDLSSGDQRLAVMTKNKRANKVRFLFSRLKHDMALITRSRKMHHELKVIRERLDDIAADCRLLSLRVRSEEIRGLRFENMARQTDPFVCVDNVVGREKDKKAILDLVLDSNSSTTEDNVSIIPIVGIGGVGKTTLAQLIYNDEQVEKHFDLKVWVHVSYVFDLSLILRNIIESATKKKYEIVDVVRDLREIIAEKKCLLVLDDVWSEDPMSRSELKKLLRGGARGSKILLTTRSQSVAKIVGTVSPFFLEGLSESESWSLFKQRALRHKAAEHENSTLVAAGKEIVNKCAGVPLAIICVGDQLHFNETENEWLYYKGKGLLEIDQNNVIFQALKLSFDNLPMHLKRCFAYCSVFPKGHRIDKQILIQRWIAQGFIDLFDGTQQPEDVGDQYFMHLLNQCFFQDVWEGLEGNVISCKMHDLIHDLAQRISESENDRITSDVIDFAGSTRHAGSIRHVSISTHMDLAWEIRTFSEPPKLKAFVLATQERRWGLEKELEHTIFSNETITSFKSARVLDLHGLGIKRVPSSIRELTRLNFLDLSNNSFLLLPEFICMLQNLQTLKLNGCKYLKELPRETKNLISLRHLEIQGCSLNYMPRGLGQLTSLRTLTRFVLDRKDKSTVGFSGGLSELEGLVNLRGTLCIERLRGSIAEKLRKKGPKKYYLDRLEFLQSLSLIWDGDEHDAVSDDELLLESLRPPRNIKKLFIHRYGGVKIGFSLPNLVEVELSCCHRCQHLTTFGLLPRLQVLRLSVMESLEYIYEEDYYDFPSSSYSEAQGLFPSLKQLHLYCLEQLKGLGSRRVVKEAILRGTNAAELKSPHSFGATLHLAALQELHISSCPQLDLYADDKERINMRLMSFTFISVTAMPQLTSLPLWLQFCTNLQPIQIQRCPNLILPEWTGSLGLLSKLQIGADLELEAH